GIALRDRGTEHRNRKSTALNRGVMRDRVDSARKAGKNCETILNEETSEFSSASPTLIRRLPRSHNRNTRGIDEVPYPLEVQKLDRMIGVRQFRWILTRPVNPDSEVLDTGVPNRPQRQARIPLDV